MSRNGPVSHTSDFRTPPLNYRNSGVFGSFGIRRKISTMVAMDFSTFNYDGSREVPKKSVPRYALFRFWRILAFHWIPIECKGTTVSYLFVVARWFSPKGTKCKSPAQKSLLVKSWVSAFWSNFTHVKSPHPPSEFQKQCSFWDLWHSEEIFDHGCDGFLDI